MLLKAFDESRLWRGQIQRSMWPTPVYKPPMILPEIRRTLGGTNPPSEPIWDEITRSYAAQSSLYWYGAKKRAAEYRQAERGAAEYRQAEYQKGLTPPYR